MNFWENDFERFFEGAILKSLNEEQAFSIKAFLTIVCNSYSGKESLKIRKKHFKKNRLLKDCVA